MTDSIMGVNAHFKHLFCGAKISPKFLRKYFRDNCYPKFLFDKCLGKFFINKFQPIMPITTVPKLSFYASLPYSNDKKFLTSLIQIINKYFFFLNPKLVLMNPKTVSLNLKIELTLLGVIRTNLRLRKKQYLLII